MNVSDMSYRQWQKRNSETFNQLTKAQQQIARKQGYHNVGWQRVQDSWTILQQWNTPLSLFDVKLKRGDLSGAIDLSILEAEKAQETAQQGISNLNHKRHQLHDLTKKTLDKYQLL